MPRKTFTAGEVLAAADVNLYLSNETTLTVSTAASYTVLTSDRYKILEFDSASAQTVTFSTATAFEAGERVDILRDGAGTVTINRASTAVSIFGRGTAGTAYRITSQYDAVSVICVANNAYRIIGGVTAI